MNTPAWEIRFEEYYKAYEDEQRKQGTYYIQPKYGDMLRFLRFVDAYVAAQPMQPMQDGQHQPVVAPEVGGPDD
jgi:hypothetical protein